MFPRPVKHHGATFVNVSLQPARPRPVGVVTCLCFVGTPLLGMGHSWPWMVITMELTWAGTDGAVSTGW